MADNYFQDEAAIMSLVDFLTDNKEALGLKEIYDNQPYRSDDMVLPCASVYQVSAMPRTPLNSPIILSEQSGVDTDGNPTQIITKEVAEYDGPLMLDIYAGYKALRSQIYAQIINLFRSGEEDTGLTLVMPKYYNSIATFELVDHEYPDGPDDEWRILIRINVNHAEIRQDTVYTMATIDLKAAIGNNIDDESLVE